MSDKIKIMYLAANPTDTGHLRLQEEARELEERIRQGPHRDAFEVIHCLAARPRDLLRGLQEIQPHIMHFSGHGNFEKEIVLQDDAGASRPIAPQDFADLVGLFKTNLKVALMSCCYGRKQAEALNQVLDFTIGMDKPISDQGAVSCSAAFYQVLAAGGSIKQAFGAARLLTTMEGHPVFEVSDLLVRDGADADKPFVEVLPISRPEIGDTPKGSNEVIQTIDHSPTDMVFGMSGNNNEINVKR